MFACYHMIDQFLIPSNSNLSLCPLVYLMVFSLSLPPTIKKGVYKLLLCRGHQTLISLQHNGVLNPSLKTLSCRREGKYGVRLKYDKINMYLLPGNMEVKEVDECTHQDGGRRYLVLSSAASVLIDSSCPFQQGPAQRSTAVWKGWSVGPHSPPPAVRRRRKTRNET